jgi:transcription antitermination factor NusG
MPVVEADATIFPDDLFEATGPRMDDPERRWWVFRTKPRQEKAVAREHLRRSIPFFLPTNCTAPEIRRGKRLSTVPLFPGYLFGFVRDEERFRIDRTGRLASFVAVPDQDRLWSELRNLHELIGRGLNVHPVLKLKEGSYATIRSGPLKGITGIVERSAGQCRFIVRIGFLQAGAGVVVDEWDLEAVH